MSKRYEIVDCQPHHLSMVARRLRDDDRSEITASGMHPRNLMRVLYKTSSHRWAAFVDGEIALVGGCAGMLLSSVGEPWLFTTSAIERVPMAFVKESRRWLSEVMKTRPTLVGGCLSTYARSLRFWAMLGFRVGETMTYPSGMVFRKLTMER